MSELLELYVRKLSQEGVNAHSYRSSKLKNRLISSFGTRLSNHQPLDRSQSEIVYSSHAKTGEVVETIVKTSGKQWADEDGTEKVPPEHCPEENENEMYFNVNLHVFNQYTGAYITYLCLTKYTGALICLGLTNSLRH